MAASLNRAPSTASRCACCERALASGLWIQAEGLPLCEACFLSRHRAPQETVSASDAAATLAQALVEALDLREHETGLHSRRVACHTLVLARRVESDPGWLHQVYWGSLLHDIGKIGIPDAILLKHGDLDEQEWREMRKHSEKGHRILSQVPELVQAAELVYSHEERFDGSGYPRGLAGESIPLGARLFAVIDTLDAMTSDRPYRRAASFESACEEIARMSGTQFDPRAVEVFTAEEDSLRQMVALKCTTATGVPTPVSNVVQQR
jgi:HD-GYP domain-containing protein (c-di-GMP phosphodiesterase class II)